MKMMRKEEILRYKLAKYKSKQIVYKEEINEVILEFESDLEYYPYCYDPYRNNGISFIGYDREFFSEIEDPFKHHLFVSYGTRIYKSGKKKLIFSFKFEDYNYPDAISVNGGIRFYEKEYVKLRKILG